MKVLALALDFVMLELDLDYMFLELYFECVVSSWF